MRIRESAIVEDSVEDLSVAGGVMYYCLVLVLLNGALVFYYGTRSALTSVVGKRFGGLSADCCVFSREVNDGIGIVNECFCAGDTR